ncbi:hypothetical protein C7S14_8459 [Burkholderia cepacia]|nr:hypothetical protein C7S14_8459 [Burkholderia cepacia]
MAPRHPVMVAIDEPSCGIDVGGTFSESHPATQESGYLHRAQ